MYNSYFVNMYMILRRIGANVSSTFKEAGYDFTLEHFLVFFLLGRNKRITQSEIAKETLRSKATITRAIDQLVKGGFVKRRINPKDRRSVHLTLTEKGRQACSHLMELAQKWEGEALQGISSERLDVGIDLLKTMRRHIGY